jgi:hypothetical protein
MFFPVLGKRPLLCRRVRLVICNEHLGALLDGGGNMPKEIEAGAALENCRALIN